MCSLSLLNVETELHEAKNKNITLVFAWLSRKKRGKRADSNHHLILICM